MQLADAGEPAAALVLCDAYEAETPGDPDVRLQRFYFLNCSATTKPFTTDSRRPLWSFRTSLNSSCNGHKCRATGQDDAALVALLEVVEDDRATAWRNSIWSPHST